MADHIRKLGYGLKCQAIAPEAGYLLAAACHMPRDGSCYRGPTRWLDEAASGDRIC